MNFKSIYHMTMATVPILRAKKRGCIINIGSVSGMRPRPGLVWYSASKAAVNVLSKAMAAELASKPRSTDVAATIMMHITVSLYLDRF